MRYLNNLPLFLKSETQVLEFIKHKAHLHSQLKQQKPNTILKEYIKSKSTHKALSLFRSLWRKGSSSIDSFSLLFILKACIMKPSETEGRQFHALTVSLGFEQVIFLQSTLINMYSALGKLDDAHQMFDEILLRNVVCWTALVSAYVDNGKPSKALNLFRQMQMENVEPDQVTITVALSACADLGALDMGEWIHAYVRRKQGFEVDLSLNNALINMYAKCGDIRTARSTFDNVAQRDVTTWTSMIVGHALHGEAEEALKLFKEMIRTGENSSNGSILPNEITFIGVLIACSHAGLVEEGFHHLESMSKRYGLKPRISHYGCMVDLLCRAGLLRKAYDFIMDMPIRPNAVVWRTLLGACSLQGDIELGVDVRRRLLKLEPSYVGDDITMSNTYAAAGMWDEKIGVRTQIKNRRAPGCSSIEVGSGVHEFVAADKSHLQWREIFEVLEGMFKNMKAYAPV